MERSMYCFPYFSTGYTTKRNNGHTVVWQPVAKSIRRWSPTTNLSIWNPISWFKCARVQGTVYKKLPVYKKKKSRITWKTDYASAGSKESVNKQKLKHTVINLTQTNGTYLRLCMNLKHCELDVCLQCHSPSLWILIHKLLKRDHNNTKYIVCSMFV